MARLLFWLALSCTFCLPAAAQKLRVVCTIFPISDLVRQLGGDAVEVSTLLAAGANPHTYEPQPAQMRDIAAAGLVVEVGAGLDNWVRKLLDARSSAAPVLTITAGVPLLQASDAHGHGAGNDPHIWLDPLLVRDHVVPALARQLGALQPLRTEQIAGSAALLQQRLTELHSEIENQMRPLRGRSYVAFHSAWRYFAQRYGLRETAVIEPFPGKELSAREIAEIVAAARRAGAKTLLVEPQLGTHVAEQVAREFGGRVARIDPYGDPRRPERDSYEKLLRYTAERLQEALQ